MAPTIPIEFSGQRESKKCLKSGLSDMMGKTRKVSKGYSSGFVPDYRQVVDNMAESEGFGSSVRVDMEMTASEDSCAPKRKCISLNKDGYDTFGIPVEMMSLSKMSRTERKDLELRLRNELEQVRILQRKIASFGSGAAVMSPTSDIHSCSNGQKRPVKDTFQKPTKEASAPLEKKKGPPVRNGPRTKGAGSKRPEPVRQGFVSNAGSILAKQCETLLNRMMSHQYGWVFNTPVDVVKLNIPDYFNIIKHPMDLGTVKRKLNSGEYANLLDFAADVRLAFSNAMTYNPPGNDVHLMAQTLSKFFEVRWKPIEKKIPAKEDESLPPRSSVIVESETTTGMPPSKIKRTASPEVSVRQEPVKRVMSDAEKHKLSTELALLPELPENIMDVLRENINIGSQVSEDEVELDIDVLSDDTLFKLRKLLDDHLLEKKKNETKAEPCEMELHNESGFSNSPVQPLKGNGPAEEDVDIVGNDMPISSFPPVEIEKDIARRGSKCSSSSSSSSDSGSSSSDSDSGSSSGGESDGGAKEVASAGVAKDTLELGVNLEEKEGVRDSPEIKDSFDAPVENSTSIAPDDRHDEESAPPERQVSPEKLYRAALLRSRFADTILKAQEKTLEKGERLDPEKLRLEREELDKRRREEKARLQAEAKAAEEARRKAEAQAAAESKKKREQEREAARQALLKMEKTVDINENSQFMEDLEMFRAAPDEELQSLIEEASPSHSQNGLGSFKFQGSNNPLEKLGLYMKRDDDDDEEIEPSIPDPPNDPEEGEID